MLLRAIALALPLTIGACSALFAISDDAASGVRDGGNGGDEGDRDGTAGGEGGISVDAGLACPQDMVSAEKFCIDRTEVSAEQYAAFVAADKSGLVLPPECAEDTNLDAALPPPSPQHPVLVEWCGAYAYCAWAGKRLCGAFDGGALVIDSGSGTFDLVLDRRQNEWLWACEHGESGNTYPYGNDVERDACAPQQTGTAGSVPSYYGLTPVGTHPDCVGGYPGLLDMSGNAAEWINARAIGWIVGDAGAEVYAMNQSAECRSSAGPLSPHTLKTRQNTYGIRCCFSP